MQEHNYRCYQILLMKKAVILARAELEALKADFQAVHCGCQSG